MKIRQLMNAPVSCRREHTLNHAAQLMWDHCLGFLPVLDSDEHIVGVITDRDICMAAYTQGKLLRDIVVDTTMARSVFSCRAEDNVIAAEKTMQERQVRRLPVVDAEARLVGIVSLDDLARQAAADRASRAPAVKLADVGETLAAICQPRAPTATA